MYCPYCGAPRPADSRTCVRCNSPLPPRPPAPPPGPSQEPVDLAAVVPVRTWLSDKPWNQPWVRWFAFFAFFPLACRLYYQGRLTLENAAWAFGLYFAGIWGLILRQSLLLKQLPVKAIFAVGASTVIVVSVYIRVAYLVGFSQFQQNWTSSPDLMVSLAANIVLVGFVEETLKALPLIWAFLKRKLPTTPREAAFLGGISGLAFGVAEAVQYSFLYSEKKEIGALNYGSYLAVELLRLISSPLLHALWASVTGYFVGLAATFPNRSRALVVVAIVMMGTIHGLFDEFSDSWISILICLVSLILFVGYSRTAEQIMEKLQKGDAAGVD